MPTLRETKEDCASFDLSLRAGLINALAAGMYSYLPAGLRVLNNIQGIIRKHMNATGANEILMPALHPIEIWKKTGRDEVIGDVMYRIKNRKGSMLCLGPTHEEIVTDILAKFLSSYKQLPITLYQIQTKFRDEMRPKGGLIRGCEFVMKDAYSFSTSEESLKAEYAKMYQAYRDIFDECGLRYVIQEADTGFIGGSLSHEFMVAAAPGEDKIFYSAANDRYGTKDQLVDCADAQETNALEVGHIFQLGTKYSAAMGAEFQDESGKRKPAIMGCYGIGVSRIISAAIEQNHDEDGIVWPKHIAPFDIQLVCLDPADETVFAQAKSLYDGLQARGFEVLFDERQSVTPGVKFKDARLAGMPVTVAVGKKSLANGTVETEIRRGKIKSTVAKDDIDAIANLWEQTR
jgi:prolyl-tRNA synthetase